VLLVAAGVVVAEAVAFIATFLNSHGLAVAAVGVRQG